AIGFNALASNTTSSFNTATGSGALISNTTGGPNTATGAGALSSNTTGNNNTADGFEALFNNTNGTENAATGYTALFSNTSGSDNTADGVNALASNTTGANNTATGLDALYNNTTGFQNTATGVDALTRNTTGSNNTATGWGALELTTTGGHNTANGYEALYNNKTGGNNVALGYLAGHNLTTGSNSSDIGNQEVAAEANTIRIGTAGKQTAAYIAGINGVTVASGVGVIIDTNGHLGTIVSSARFKEAIKPMNKASEAILALQPMTFRYKHELDPDGVPQFGLIAEEVEKVDPELVGRDENGKVNTVRYEAVNAMLLNEFLKEHRMMQDLKATVAQEQAASAQQQARIEKQQ